MIVLCFCCYQYPPLLTQLGLNEATYNFTILSIIIVVIIILHKMAKSESNYIAVLHNKTK